MFRRLTAMLLLMFFTVGSVYAAERQGIGPAKSIEEANARQAQFNELLKQNKEAWAAKDYSKAIEALKKAYELAPNNSGVAYNLACLYALTGEKAEALDWLERSVRLGTANPQHILNDNDLVTLREEPRFKAAVANAKE